MKNRYLTNLILLVSLIGLYYFVNDEPNNIETTQSRIPSQLSPSTVSTINIKRRARKSIEIIKEGSNWTVINPVQASANNVRIKLILDLLSAPIHNQIELTDDIELNQFGLKPAHLSLQLNQQLFEFGTIESLSKRRYVKHDEVIYLINDTLVPLLNSTASSFIDNRLFSKTQPITKLELPLLSKGGKVSNQSVIIQLSNGHWTSNIKTLSNDLLTSLVESWQHAYAMQVLTISKDDVNLISGTKINISFKDSPTSEFMLQLSTNNLSLINVEKQLKYQFPISIKQKLLTYSESD